MQASPPVRPAATVLLVVACPLLSAVTFAAIAWGLAALLGDRDALAIGALIGAVVFAVNAAALCMARTRGDDERTSAFATRIEVTAAEHARAAS